MPLTQGHAAEAPCEFVASDPTDLDSRCALCGHKPGKH